MVVQCRSLTAFIEVIYMNLKFIDLVLEVEMVSDFFKINNTEVNAGWYVRRRY